MLEDAMEDDLGARTKPGHCGRGTQIQGGFFERPLDCIRYTGAMCLRRHESACTTCLSAQKQRTLGFFLHTAVMPKCLS